MSRRGAERQGNEKSIEEVLQDAGCLIGPSGCAACLGGPADTFGRLNEALVCISTTMDVFNRMQSERQILISKSQNEGDAEAAKIRSAADRKAAELLANAEAEATRIRGQGEAEAAKSLAVFQQNPELASFLFRLSALETSLKERTTLVFDQQTPPFTLFRGAATNTAQK